MGGGIFTVNPDGTGLEGVADTDSRVEVVGVDGGGEAIGAIVGEVDDLLLGLELGHGADGAEDLLAHDLHVRGHAAEDGGLDEVALVAVAAAARLERGAVLLAVLDVAHDPVVLQLADLRALEGLLVEGVADGVGGCPRLEGREELVVDPLLHIDARAGAAALAVVVVDAEVDPGDGLLDIGIVEDDVGRLASKFKRHLLQVGRSGSLHDGTADDGGAGEGDLIDVHVRGDGGASNPAEARDNVEHTGMETGLLNKVGKYEGGQGRLLGGLQNDGVARSKSRRDLPGQHQQWEVPWDNLTADSNL